MFFALSKIIGLFLNPLVWIIALLIGAVFSKSGKRKRNLLLTAIIVTYIFGNSFIFNKVVQMWEPAPVSESQLTQTYDYGIVLSGMVWYDTNTHRTNFLKSSGRIWHAVRLYKKGKIKKILISGGGAGFFERQEIESLVLKNFLTDIGIPAEDIVTEEKSRNTRENAKFTAEYLQNKPHDKILLITSATHIKRSDKCFKKEGLNCSLYPVDYVSGKGQNSIDKLLVPNPKTLLYWNVFLHEIFGLMSYKIVGYV